jgi:hypothetical protein
VDSQAICQPILVSIELTNGFNLPEIYVNLQEILQIQALKREHIYFFAAGNL